MYIIYIMFLTLLFLYLYIQLYTIIYNYIDISTFTKYRTSIKNISLKINILSLYIIFTDIIRKKY